MTWARKEQLRKRLAAEENTVSLGVGDRLRVCLCYPNTYSVGMSNLGFQALYHLLNSVPGVRCERAFLPEEEEPGQLLSLDTQTPVGNFDVIAFSISFDLDIVNVPRMLALAGIPVFAAERADGPLVMAGGIVPTFNPEPLAEIVDAFLIGEAEEAVSPLAEILISSFSRGAKQDRLAALAQLPGMYVPSLYQVKYEAAVDSQGGIAAVEPAEQAPQTVKRVFVRALDAWPCHSRVLTEETEFGKLFLVEVSRGCARGCRFCVAGHAYQPLRYRSVENIIFTARAGLEFRDTIGLIGAAVSDHPEIEKICNEVREAGGKISLASIRADSLIPSLLEAALESGAKTLTLAPEAGTQRLRDLIGKGLTEEDILNATSEAAKLGVKRLRLYFMIGLPDETEADIEAISDLVKRVREQSAFRITVSACGFTPKPGTPFAREAMAPRKVIRQRMEMLRHSLSSKREVEITFESPNATFVQGIISRGDRRLGRVLARLAESRSSRLGDWQKALTAEQLCGEWYACRRRPQEEILPWEHIGKDRACK